MYRQNTGKERCLIDINREGKKLSMLYIKGGKINNWKKIVKLILEGLVFSSGRWNNRIFKHIRKYNVIIKRIYHIYNKNCLIYNNFE